MKGLRAWLTLLRPQNFLTVPGDLLAGFFLAAGSVSVLPVRLIWVVLAGFLFYAAGLLLNDWADAAVDRIERPERPVPAGLVSRKSVLIAGLVSILVALFFALQTGRPTALAGLALALAIISYNLLTKNLRLIGAVNMGLCRGLNLLLGSVLVVGMEIPALVWWGAGTVTVYIAAVTHLARREMNGRYNALERWFPAMIVTVSFMIYVPLSPLVEWMSQVAVAVLFAFAAIGAARCAKALPNKRGLPADARVRVATPVPGLIGKLISLLLPLQAALIIGAGDGPLILWAGAATLALWPLKSWMGRFFYSS